jgi:hypothetical protein
VERGHQFSAGEVESCIQGHEDCALLFVPPRVSIIIPFGALFGEPDKGLFVPSPDLGIRRGIEGTELTLTEKP